MSAVDKSLEKVSGKDTLIALGPKIHSLFQKLNFDVDMSLNCEFEFRRKKLKILLFFVTKIMPSMS